MSSSSYLFSFNIAIMSQILPSSRRLFRESTFVSTLGGRLTTMALRVEKEEEDARERDLFERAHQTLLESVTPFFWGVVFRVFTHLFLSLSVLNPNHFTTFFFARDDDVQKLLRSARRQKIAKANRTAWKKLERHSRRIWTNSRTS